ncbi:N-acyl-D-amino-acid deacylase family protein [Allopusillimonas ginsengisoli]|uniref:N-acyl-D-amino-acid deacylase family protein n=1 Tax=Allopusillimonas ginsengisoli TaxID=453575 RepID=UPI001022130A|nr:D-aminoacylase [Allopusillimonas ginsengisoli]TEA78890.1 D-aminoacylase [Allopusillimonas ginsengisoli]
MTYDVLIQGGLIVDGTGEAAYKSDIAVSQGQIAEIGMNLSATQAKKVIDAKGLVVAPGFIDIKTHSDFTLPINPDATSKVRQGVTTEIIGHCGFSIAPVLKGKVDLLRDYLSPSAPWITYKETSFTDYLETFPAASVNAGMLVGHNTLRLMAMGMDQREPTDAELQHMKAMLEEGLKAGALGLSSGLFTSPGSYADATEMHALGHVLKQHNATYFTHIRDESNGVLDAVKEAIEFAEACDVPVEIVHFKCSGMDNWGKARTALEMIAAANARGLTITCDSHPYTAGSNPLKNLMPQWVQAGGVDAMLERLALPSTRKTIREDIARDGLNNWGRIASWDCVQISISPHLPQFAGRTIQSLADERGLDPIDLICDYIIEDKGATRVLVISISEDDIQQIVATSSVLVGSDGNCVAHCGVTGQGMPHPRFYGTFPRILSRYVRERKALSLETAVRKMTGATAQALRLRDRGLLKLGYAADITLFDPDDFDDQATYDDPHRYPTGDRTTVLVNGVLVVENAEHTGARPGTQLRRDASGSVAGI